MNELLRKIYDDVISNERDSQEVGKKLDKEVKDLVKPYSNQFNEKDIEIVKNLMYSIMLKGEQEGFQLGVKYTLKMLIKLLTDL